MKLFQIIWRSSAAAGFVVLGACSSTAGDDHGQMTNDIDAGGTSDGSASTSNDGGAAPPGWAKFPLPSDTKVTRLGGDARGVWMAETHKSGSAPAVGAGRLATGSYERVFEQITTETLKSNYFVQAIAPIDTRSAVIVGEWFGNVIGDTSTIFSTTSTYGIAAFGRSKTDVWYVGRGRPLYNYTGSTPVPETLLAQVFDLKSLWGTSDALYFATSTGVRKAPFPLPANWNTQLATVAAGDYQDIGGENGKAVAVGKGGLVAKLEGAAWTLTTAGIAEDLTSVAFASPSDVWASSAKTLLHFNGSQWTRLAGEAGLPTSDITDLAIDPNGTLWLVAKSELHRRGPSVVVGDVTPSGPLQSDAGTGQCAFGEPGNDLANPFNLTLPIDISACIPKGDTDVYATVTPKNGIGGFFSVDITDDDHVQLLAEVAPYPASAEPALWSRRSLNGGATDHLKAFIPVASRRDYSLFVGAVSTAGEGKYAATITFTPFADALEPNDDVAHTLPITAGISITSLFPTTVPHELLHGQDDADWYIAAHAAGAVSVTVSNVASDAVARITALYVAQGSGSDGVPLAIATGATAGATTVLSTSLPGAGSIRVKIENAGSTAISEVAAPVRFTQPYSLLVSN